MDMVPQHARNIQMTKTCQFSFNHALRNSLLFQYISYFHVPIIIFPLIICEMSNTTVNVIFAQLTLLLQFYSSKNTKTL